jgi:hypothetical protein
MTVLAITAVLAARLALAGPHGAEDADPARSAAEHTRLSGDLEQLTGRQLWAGAEKKYQELEKLGIELAYEDLVHGADAARALGNMDAAYKRLKLASQAKPTKIVLDTLFAIDANYGLVELSANAPKQDTLLEPALMPFDPDARVAVEAAMAAVRTTGKYKGLLPKGDYVFASQPFSVQPGIGVRIEVSPRLRKTSGEIVKVATTPTWGSGAGDPPPEAAEPRR